MGTTKISEIPDVIVIVSNYDEYIDKKNEAYHYRITIPITSCQRFFVFWGTSQRAAACAPDAPPKAPQGRVECVSIILFMCMHIIYHIIYHINHIILSYYYYRIITKY